MLSDKAWEEIDRIRWDDAADHGVDAFRELFNMKRYPVTKEMIFNYLKDHKDFFDTNHWDTVPARRSTVDEFYFKHRHTNIKVRGWGEDTVNYVFDRLCDAVKQDEIIVFGELHGWWKKEGDSNA